DPLKADVKDPEGRRRLARVLDRGLATEAGFALPLARTGEAWASDSWRFRRGRLYLVPGDSPMGLRLPLGSLGPGYGPAPGGPGGEAAGAARGAAGADRGAAGEGRVAAGAAARAVRGGAGRRAARVRPAGGVGSGLLRPGSGGGRGAGGAGGGGAAGGISA